MNCGIYKILNTANRKFYLGSALEIEKRWREHRHYLRNGTHANEYFQRAWSKYGEASFEFLIIQICNKEDLLKYEQVWLDWTRCFERNIGYNILSAAANSLGYVHTPENKIKMKQAQLGRKRSPEHRKNIGIGLLKPDKWPCERASRCRCDRCRLIKNKYALNWTKAKKLNESKSV